MSGSNGAVNTLLKYRFVKKSASQISHSDSQDQNVCNVFSRENSHNSFDSQATYIYSNQNSFNGSQVSMDSQATLVNSQGYLDSFDSQSTQPYGSQYSSQHSVSNNAVGNSPSSPVFESRTNANHKIIINHSAPSDSPAPGPWVSKAIGPMVVSSNGNRGHIQRATARRVLDSQEEMTPLNNSPSKGDDSEDFFQRLKKMFPEKSENRMRAALIVYPRDFNKAVQFMVSEPSPKPKSGEKRTVPDSDELPEIRGNYKRIKMMPRSPSPVRVLSVDFLKESSKSELFQKGIEFLQGCFPAKSVEHLRKVLEANNGNTETAVEALTNEDSADALLAQSLSEKEAGPSSSVRNIGKQNSALKSNLSSSKVRKKSKKDIDLSDEDDDYDEYDNSGDSDDSEDLDNKTKSETDNFLQFFEEATVEELTAMPGCSKKKAEVIISLRPFKTWQKLLEAFNTEKSLSTSLISGCKEIMQVRNTIRRLMMRCESISQQMGQVVSKLTKHGGSYSEKDDKRITKQPDLLPKELELQPYQLIGLSWLRIMHEQQLNGILADEMGLGKTIQAIAFLAHLMEEGEEGPHVIIVPSSTIENWLRELQRWCPTLKVVVYYGSQEERRAVRHSIFFQGEEFNVLLTTYNMATGGVEDRVLFKKFEFHYAVFDEGHMLKNMSSLRFQNLMKIAAERRLLLTGTPLQNNLLELMSLLCFVMPEIFQGKTDHLKKVFAMISRSEDKQKSRFEKDRIAQAKRIMKPFVLRRLKRDVLQQLPKKTERIEKCCMIPAQQDLYDRLVTKYSQELKDDEDTSTIGGVGIFMQFRKAANHPLLLRNLYTDDQLKKMAKDIAREPSHKERGALPHLIEEDMSVLNDFELLNLCKQYKKYLGKYCLDQSVILDSGKFRKLDELLPGMKEKGDRVLLFSQFTMMLDIVELYLEERGHKYIRMDGQTPVPDRLQLIDRFNNEPDIFIFLLSTRAGGVGINLAAANTIILHDIDFNPYNDKQAEDRCHRLGQKREVTVVKLLCEDTVDEAMLRCANDKLALEKDLTGPTNDGESEENSKDVANLLKEVLRSRQKKKDDHNESGSSQKEVQL
ncbi:SWI/SNF-related matrix-associated actin-dependent regulator of chromatin subfamily A containing DEAD/H box 1A-like isoform X2 [Physella acuta]|nr:SWI/SNF-related matrix-associated actin-dependent regulator of chromatin subfamily A containing DEAD/H box 1A-like isoform X2 [Physella acuta]